MNDATISIDDFLIAKPFDKAGQILFSNWFSAADLFSTNPPSSWEHSDFTEVINAKFAELESLPTLFDRHITEGFLVPFRKVPRARGSSDELEAGRGPVRKWNQTRPYLLLKSQFEAAFSANRERSSRDPYNRPRANLPHPLFFVRQMLTAPSYGASESYAHVFIRAQIFAGAIQFALNSRRFKSSESPYQQVRFHTAFDKVAASLRKAAAYLRRGDTFPVVDPTDFIVGTLLASKGLAFVSLAPEEKTYETKRANEPPLMNVVRFLRNASIIPDPNESFEFKFAPELDRIPPATELINEIDGVSLPVLGASTIFNGGLRTSSRRGVIIRVSGNSGTGKTSFALAVASSLAPLGVCTFYLSCEEDPKDLLHRLATLTPPFVSQMRSYERDLNKWFSPTHLDALKPAENLKEAGDIIDGILANFASAGIDPTVDYPPGLVPYLVIFDGIHELFERPTSDEDDHVVRLRDFVEHFRSLGAIVIVMSADSNEPALKDLDFIVDVAITLHHEHLIDLNEEPRRKLVLHKTRLQQAFAGAHLFHISKDTGFKLYPNLPAQLASYSLLKWKSVKKNSYYDFLQTAFFLPETSREPSPLVKIFEGSHVLLSGHGSSGKAGFALRLLSSSLIEERGDAASDRSAEIVFGQPELFSSVRDRQRSLPRRVLVVSFLYTEEYYLTLQKDMLSQLRRKRLPYDSISKRPLPEVKLDVLHFYPGFLAPEILVAKVLRKLKAAQLDGLPIHGVIIDGLHNVFLQFPRLEEAAHLMWPTLEEAFRMIGLTVVTTHTHFSIQGMDTDASLLGDVKLANRRVAPLLQALINSADFYLDISRESKGSNYPIEVISALSQDVRKVDYAWKREKFYAELLTKSDSESRGKDQ